MHKKCIKSLSRSLIMDWAYSQQFEEANTIFVEFVVEWLKLLRAVIFCLLSDAPLWLPFFIQYCLFVTQLYFFNGGVKYNELWANKTKKYKSWEENFLSLGGEVLNLRIMLLVFWKTLEIWFTLFWTCQPPWLLFLNFLFVAPEFSQNDSYFILLRA